MVPLVFGKPPYAPMPALRQDCASRCRSWKVELQPGCRWRGHWGSVGVGGCVGLEGFEGLGSTLGIAPPVTVG